ncbi:hypothetical protein LBY39_002080 [Vibrio parahaemolyticus]|nr:hypothetical protein [Vibrio parahaemolyticus]
MNTLNHRAEKQPPYKSVLFWAIPLLIGIAVFSVISMSLTIAGFSEGLKKVLETYQLPITLVSWCIAFMLQWHVAHQSSKPTELEIQQSIARHLREEYSASEQLLVKQFGSFASSQNFTFITPDYLPAIHSNIYQEARLLDVGELIISEEVTSAFEYYFKRTEKVLEDGLQLIQKEEDKEDCNWHIKEAIIVQLLQFLHQPALFLHQVVGTRLIPIESSSIETYYRAYFEVLHLASHIGKELKPASDAIINAESGEDSNSHLDIQTMFEAAQSVAASLITIGEEATYEGFCRNAFVNNELKRAKGSDLYNLADQVLHEIILDKVLVDDTKVAPMVVDDAYPKIDLYDETGTSKLTLSFSDIDENSLLLSLSGLGENASTVIKRTGDNNEIFEITEVVPFVSACIAAVKKHLLEDNTK